jgi:MYXO-CTERM domain-containing protein
MMRSMTRGRFLPACLVAGAWLFAPVARAEVSTSVDVTNLRVSVSALSPGSTPSVTFSGAAGSTSECNVSSGIPPETFVVTADGMGAFGQASSATPHDPFVRSSAMLSGDVFGGGAVVHTSAFAHSRGPEATSQGTFGLANGVSAAVFTLAPGTRMTITADVWATASSTGASPFEYADSGLSLSLSDGDGVGPQFVRFTFDAVALGLFGAYEDVETTSVSLVYENDTDASMTGLFSGYVGSIAYAADPVSVVPEPRSGAMLSLGLGLLGLAAVGSRRRRQSRQQMSPQ